MRAHASSLVGTQQSYTASGRHRPVISRSAALVLRLAFYATAVGAEIRYIHLERMNSRRWNALGARIRLRK
jgi:hypothetical protein